MVATQILFIFTPILGEMIQFDEHIFRMGWFNHQLDLQLDILCCQVVFLEVVCSDADRILGNKPTAERVETQPPTFNTLWKTLVLQMGPCKKCPKPTCRKDFGAQGGELIFMFS